ncbi:FAS1 domain-containing protein [Fimicolochytrium jonesii]|uniref:FAS1 domain-containing protein n=1 Tax=Fimicolochytrium jonesii TaxID=1396493 RepID=UPI0022FF3B5D|nr:FAS1 domain-containing protein [Fimicolochytrium jonesii]KAI8820567.1 FAS1 domain-containing protein [Fimicolochytrium jonesii]
MLETPFKMKLFAHLTLLLATLFTLLHPTTAQDLNSLITQVENSLKQSGALSALEALFQDLKPQAEQLLAQAGEFTFFAPSNTALEKFQKKYPDLYANVTADPEWLLDVLKYHFLPGVAFDPSKAPAKSFPQTALNDDAVQVNVKGKDVTVKFDGGQAKVTESVTVAKGVVHVVDTVLTPPRALADVAKDAGLTSLIKAVQTAGLAKDAAGLTKFTLFAPTNRAFDRITTFAKSQNVAITPALLASILKFHIAPHHEYFSTDLPTDGKPVTVASALKGADLTVSVSKNVVSVSGAGTRSFKLPPGKVTKADILVKGGVVHVIDHVVLPDLKGAGAKARRSEVLERAEFGDGESAAAGGVRVSRAVWALGVVAAVVVMM